MKNVPNKMIGEENVRDYHFAGTGEHPPMTISARSQEEAEQKRKEKIVVVKSSYEEDEALSKSPRILEK